MQVRNDIRSEFSILINWNLKKAEKKLRASTGYLILQF